ncbi:uncharacterized protein LOC126901011 isoform X2 [Daktulosphaira vitifoliae]|uniref:uncharacterized protein LOC126901011 isoform X2 n=1 Tax=Daktulosphaira vitifoliae TaxID=58002 RepID=UPI0021AAB0F4|nr:uncharacterized protein LOC126901011 isoform X2 [Daktulosphaira vitifoliae]
MSAITCRICGRVFDDPSDVIHIFSAAGKKDNVAAKILYTLTIMITEEDPTSKHICKMCYGHIDFFTRFSNTSRVYNNILMNNYLKEPSNVTYRYEMARFLSTPVELLCYKQNSDIRSIHESFVNYMKSPVLNEINVSQLKEPISQNLNESASVNQPNTSNKSDHFLQTSNQNEKENNNTCMNNIQPNQSVSNILIQPSNVINQSSVRCNRQTNVSKPHSSNDFIQPKIIDEVICLDDDDGDAEDDDVQVIENTTNVLSNNTHKKRKSKVMLKNKSFFPKNNVINNTHAIALKHLMQFKRRLENASKNTFQSEKNITPLLTGNQQSPISEQMVITPDINLPTVVNTSSCDSPNNDFYSDQVNDNNSTESTVSPETGFHFLFRSDQTVDLTNSEIAPKKKFQMPMVSIQKPATKLPPPVVTKNISNAVTQFVFKYVFEIIILSTLHMTSIVNVSRSKRIQTTSTTSESKKIKKPTEPNNTTNQLTACVSLIKLELPLYQCPICEKYFSSTKSRQLHESKSHVLPPIVPEKSDKLDLTSCDNSSSTSQQEFLTHLNLVKRVSTNLPEHFANRKHLQNALKIYGNIQGKYKCHYCKYKTSRLYTLWAHMCVNHIQFNTDMRSNSFCFVCNRTFGKRLKLLKHLDRCVESHLEIESSNNPCDEMLACDYSDSEINSLPELEEKLWSLVNV